MNEPAPETPDKSADALPGDMPRRSGREAPHQTLARGLRILRFIGQSPGLVRLRDVAQAFRLDRSIALRILQSLEAEGFLRRHEPIKAYSLGPALDELRRPRSLVERLSDRARPFLDELMLATGQTSHIGILDADRAVLIGVRMANGPVAVQQAPGDLESLYCSAIGKAIYAFRPAPERKALAARVTFHRFKPATLSSVDALEAEAAIIRRDGVAFDRDEGPAPLACIAVPILDETEQAVASVGISSISALLKTPIEQHGDWIDAVRACARKVQADLR
jgi:DNA-binding IclR family transcriptional regulator